MRYTDAVITTRTKKEASASVRVLDSCCPLSSFRCHITVLVLASASCPRLPVLVSCFSFLVFLRFHVPVLTSCISYNMLVKNSEMKRTCLIPLEIEGGLWLEKACLMKSERSREISWCVTYCGACGSMMSWDLSSRWVFKVSLTCELAR